VRRCSAISTESSPDSIFERSRIVVQIRVSRSARHGGSSTPVDLFAGQVLIAVVDGVFGEDQQRVERREQLVRNVGEEFDLYSR